MIFFLHSSSLLPLSLLLHAPPLLLALQHYLFFCKVVALLLLQFLLGKKGKGIGGTPHVQYILRREEESGSITRSVDATLVATAGITRMKLTKVH